MRKGVVGGWSGKEMKDDIRGEGSMLYERTPEMGLGKNFIIQNRHQST